MDYRFLTPERFEGLLEEGAFLESATVHGYRYGTLASDVSALEAAGKVVILEIDVQGARSIREVAPDATLVFVLPPDPGTLAERLSHRATERADDMELRLRNAAGELPEAAWFDHQIINDDLGETVVELGRIIDQVSDTPSADPPVKEFP